METKILITYKWSLLQIEDLVSILAVKPVTFIG